MVTRTWRAVPVVRWSLAGWSLAIFGATACSLSAPAAQLPHTAAPTEATAPEFSGARALAQLREFMDWPRTLGHPDRGGSIDELARRLRVAGADSVEREAFVAADPQTGQPFELVNVFGHVRPEAPRRFILATHFDTRPWADEDPDRAAHALPVPGANDGTSGVAVVVELLGVLSRVLPSDIGLTVILFDGEELGRPQGSAGYCMGSRHFAERFAEDRPPWLANAELGIVFDMVGDRDLHLPIEPTSFAHAPQLVRRLWAVAEARGHQQFEDRLRPIGILDDHEFLNRTGVPSIVLIDKEYPPWHTLDDTVDKVSAESLGAVGDTVLHTLLGIVRTPLPPPQ